MNKALNNTFIKQLIDSDFLFTKSSLIKNNLTSSINIDQKNQFNILDIFKVNTSLKQLIRILQLLKLKKNFCIHIWCNNAYILGLINKFVIDFSMTKIISTSVRFPEVDRKKINFLFILGKPSNQKLEKIIYTKILDKRISLVNKFNFSLEREGLGFYKIKNDLYDYKKLILLLIIIHNTINKK